MQPIDLRVGQALGERERREPGARQETYVSTSGSSGMTGRVMRWPRAAYQSYASDPMKLTPGLE